MLVEPPDARDGLTREERIVLVVLHRVQDETGRGVHAALLYGRVIEHVDMSQEQFMQILERLSTLRAPLVVRSQQNTFLAAGGPQAKEPQ